MTMHNPAHPGEIIREECLAPLGLTVTAAAEGLGVSRKALSTLLNGHAGVSPDIAIRLEKAGWSRAEAWLRMQLAYDLWHAQQRAGSMKVVRFAVPALAQSSPVAAETDGSSRDSLLRAYARQSQRLLPPVPYRQATG